VSNETLRTTTTFGCLRLRAAVRSARSATQRVGRSVTVHADYSVGPGSFFSDYEDIVLQTPEPVPDSEEDATVVTASPSPPIDEAKPSSEGSSDSASPARPPPPPTSPPGRTASPTRSSAGQLTDEGVPANVPEASRTGEETAGALQASGVAQSTVLWTYNHLVLVCCIVCVLEMWFR
jgi:hypothetical protein